MLKLDSLTDEKLVKRIKSKFCSKSMEILIDRHSDIFRKAIHQYHKNHPETNVDDLLDDLYIIFNRAVETFNFNKQTKFTTWLYYHSRWGALNTNKQYGKTYSLENTEIDKIHQSQDKWQNFSNNVHDINIYCLQMLGKLEDKRIATIFKMRYLDGSDKGNRVKSWNQIAPKLGISISYVILLHQKGLKFLQAKLNSNTICDEI